jgi:branched-chain amino acid transport system permease protein
MEIFIQQLVNSLSVASVTILIGMGITLIFGLAGIVNFAHGEFLMVGGMITWFLVASGINFFVALVGAMILVGALGFVAERGLFRFTLERPMNGFIMSIGVSVILQHLIIRLFNEVQKTIPDPIGKVWVVGGIDIIAMRAVVVALTAVVVAIAYFGISRSRYGMALRASIADQDTAALMGIPVKEVRSVIIDLRTKFSAAVLLIEQNAGLALAVAERGYLLQYGEIVASGPITELQDNRLMHELYLGQGRSGRV